MAEPLTPERIANFRETIRLHGANKETVQLPFGTFVQFLDVAEQAVTLRDENERLRCVINRYARHCGDCAHHLNHPCNCGYDAALAEGGAS